MIAQILALWPILQKVAKGLGWLKDPEEENAFKVKMIELAQREEEYFSRALESVNATMRAEAASEHWLQWSWRPVVGLTFAATIINNYILMPYFTSIQAIVIPGEVWNAMLMVLGVAAATRGWQKIEQARHNGETSAPNPSPSVREAPRPERRTEPAVAPYSTDEAGEERWRRIEEGREYLRDRFGEPE